MYCILICEFFPSKAIEKIQERESDLKKLLDGELRGSKKKPKMDENLQNEAFENYLSLFYNRTSVTLPDDSDDENAPVYRDKDTYIPDIGPNGFFGIDHQSPLKYKNIQEDEKDFGDDEQQPRAASPCNRLRSQSLPIINEEPPLEYDKNVVLEDTSIELSGDRTASPTPSDNKQRKKRKSSSAGKKAKRRSQKEIIVGKSEGCYSTPSDVLHDVSRESAELAMVEDENGKQYEAIVIAPDGYIPNSVVAALFDNMRNTQEVEVQQEEIIPYRPPQLTASQRLEIKRRRTPIVVSRRFTVFIGLHKKL